MAGQAFALRRHFFNPDIRDYFKLLLFLLSHDAAKLRQIMIFRNPNLFGLGKEYPAEQGESSGARPVEPDPSGKDCSKTNAALCYLCYQPEVFRPC
jgi:hypothetical protein